MKQKQAELAASIAKLEKEVDAIQKQLVEAETAAGSRNFLFSNFFIQTASIKLAVKQVPVPSIARAVEKEHPATVATEVKQANEVAEKSSKKDKPATEKKPTAAPGGGKKTESTSVPQLI